MDAPPLYTAAPAPAADYCQDAAAAVLGSLTLRPSLRDNARTAAGRLLLSALAVVNTNSQFPLLLLLLLPPGVLIIPGF